MNSSLNGQWSGAQWYGPMTGKPIGIITLNIEVINGEYKGRVIMASGNADNPSFVTEITLTQNNNRITGNLYNFRPIDSEASLYIDELHFKTRYPNKNIPKQGILSGNISNDELIGTYTDDNTIQNSISLKHSEADKKSSYNTSLIKSWKEFTVFIEQYNKTNKYVFRGQPGSWRLRTSYHRTGMCDLERYFNENITDLRHNICSYIDHLLDLKNFEELSILLNLAQHHGYPTPLLDWTYSPYVAAYFAFAELNEDHNQKTVRIFVFDMDTWQKDMTKAQGKFSTVLASIYFLKLPALYNKRAIPQQSVTSLTNIDDIESYIQFCELTYFKKKYLDIIEIPVSLRHKFMNELSYMNIKASSLFPSLDGTCKTLKEQHFNK